MSETSIALASPVHAESAGKPDDDQRKHSKTTTFDRIVLPVVGIAFPTMIFCGLFLSSGQNLVQIMSLRPLECTAELATFSIVPIGMLVLWLSLLRPHARLRLKRSFLAGMVIGSSTSAAVLSRILQLDQIVTLAAVCALLASLYLGFRIHQFWEFASSRRSAFAFTSCGALFCFAAIILAQVPSGLVRVAEALAVSDSQSDKTKGIELLRSLHCQQELSLHCRNQSTGSILYSLIPVNEEKLKQVLFAVTGTVAPSAPTNNADANLGQQIVGSYIPSLSMTKSSLYIVPSVKNLCATTYWTMVFRNQDDQPHEARIKIHLPPLAVVNGMTFWMEGKPKSATVCSSVSATQAYQWITQRHRDPALVTDLGNQSILAQCYPVPAGGETKLRIALAAPMGITADSRASMSLPTVEECNGQEPTEHLMQVETKEPPIISNMSFVKADGAAALFQGKISSRDLQEASLTFASKPTLKSGTWLSGTDDIPIRTETVQLVNHAPKQLVVVLDCSTGLKQSASSVLKEVKKISAHMPCTIFFAQDQEIAPVSVTSGKEIASNVKYEGGNDNTKTLIQACDFAGRKAGSAVLWIHGPQPGYDNGMYPLSPHLIPPAIYEMRAFADITEPGNRLLRNHRELGELVQVPRHANIAEDLQVFCSKWTQSGRRQVVFSYASTIEHPGSAGVPRFGSVGFHRVWSAGLQPASDLKAIAALPYCREADCLAAHLNCLRLLGANSKQAAIDFAISKSIVTPVTSVVVLENSSDYQSYGINEHPELTKKPEKSSAYLNRKMYFYRFPAAKEAGPTELGGRDVIKDQKKADGLVPPPPPHSGPIPAPTAYDARENYFKRFPFPTTNRDASINNDLFKTFGMPVSDTQFQIIQRYNDNRMTEGVLEPERVMWTFFGHKVLANQGADSIHVDLDSLIVGLLLSSIVVLCPITVTGAVLFWYLKATREPKKQQQPAAV